MSTSSSTTGDGSTGHCAHRPHRQPAAARLVAREARPVGEQHRRAGLGEAVRGGRAGRPAADDEDVEALHLVRLQCPALQGGVPERPKGTGCKPVGSAYGGSNPPAPIESSLARVLGDDSADELREHRPLAPGELPGEVVQLGLDLRCDPSDEFLPASVMATVTARRSRGETVRLTRPRCSARPTRPVTLDLSRPRYAASSLISGSRSRRMPSRRSWTTDRP